MLEIGQHLLALPESSSLKAACLASRRLNHVLSSARDQSLQLFIQARRRLATSFRKVFPHQSWAVHSLCFMLTNYLSAELRSFIINDTIDFVADAQCGDGDKSRLWTVLLIHLDRWVEKSELLSIAERLVGCHNRLPAREQAGSLVAIARLVNKEKFPLEALEAWIARLTNVVVTQTDTLAPEAREAVLIELAQLTGRLLSDEKKS